MSGPSWDPVRHRQTAPDTPFIPPPGPVVTLPQANSQPLIHIVFLVTDPAVTLDRYWSHVPRVGDKVRLDLPPVDTVPVLVAARVSEVVWLDNGTVEVYLR